MKIRILLIISLAILAIAICARIPWGVIPAIFIGNRLDREKEKSLLYNVNHELLAAELRRFASEERWSKQAKDLEPMLIDADDPRVPSALRVLRSSGITIFDDRIEYDCGGAFLSFGISVFREGLPGNGTKKLGDGVWFYAEDGRVPSE